MAHLGTARFQLVERAKALSVAFPFSALSLAAQEKAHEYI